MIQLEFIGAAQTVTGSKHLVRTSRASVLLDCGMFQGHRKEAYEKNRNLPEVCHTVDAVVLSHAHIDHSGALPSLYCLGYRGPIYTTSATRDLCEPMLLDTAYLMKADAEHIRKLISRGVHHFEPMEPLYSQDDVAATLKLFHDVEYSKPQVIAPGITLTLLNAGHVLGSAICVLDIDDEGQRRRIAFTGDLGRKHLPILSNPEIPEGVEYLLMESTYGDRLHDPIELMPGSLAQVIKRTVDRGGKVVIPSFALERAQEVIYELSDLYRKNLVPRVPVYVDSPLTVKLTDVFKRHPECYDRATYDLLGSEKSPFQFDELQYVSTVEDSRRISSSSKPAIVISASGMCEGGRILHHLQSVVEDARNTVLIVGYQAENTLGRKIVDHAPKIRIFGSYYELKAEVSVLNGFSGHADQKGLLNFTEAVRNSGKLRHIYLVHGEPAAQTAFQKVLNQDGFLSVEIPAPGEKINL